MKKYITEREGQIDFFENYHIPWQDDDEILVANTDGIWKGNLFEFKLNINNVNSVAFQAIKYLSKLRIQGKSVPENFLLISLNTTTAYVFHSEDYRNHIQKVYVGAASQNNASFVADNPYLILDYSSPSDAITLKGILNEWKYMPVDLDEDCILGWAERYYRENPKASKGDFLGDASGQVPIVGEIREPKHFKGLIHPYKEKTNAKFQYLMDCLNDRLRKKDLGAFYTPEPYCRKAAELVRMAIQRVPVGNDYIILDRCAGTGNLEAVLTDEELSHCILSTYEYYEYKVLQERLGDKVRFIVPPTEAHVEYANGCIMNADAMSEEYINNPDIKRFVDNPKCTIILYENPPYRDENSMDGNNRTGKAQSFIRKEMARCLANNKNTYKDLANQFIWSGMKYYLRQTTDSYIVFSPIKYWKTEQLANKKFLKGYLLNRGEFHAQNSAISCILWGNENEEIESINLPAVNIDGETETTVKVQKAFHPLTDYYDRRTESADMIDDSIYCSYDGYPTTDKKLDGHTRYNDNIIACADLPGFVFDPKLKHFTRVITYRGRGFFVRKDNYLEKLPLFAAKWFPIDNWYEKDVYSTTSDGGDRYTKDKEFLKECLIYTCLSNQNKCLSFLGSDGRDYQNELCFDNSKSELPMAYQDLQHFSLNGDEETLLTLWNKILEEARTTDNYDSHWNYGVYQITKELDTYHEEGSGRTKKKVYDYPTLHGNLDSLRTLLKAYYKKYITPKMFEYELLK